MKTAQLASGLTVQWDIARQAWCVMYGERVCTLPEKGGLLGQRTHWALKLDLYRALRQRGLRVRGGRVIQVVRVKPPVVRVKS